MPDQLRWRTQCRRPTFWSLNSSPTAPRFERQAWAAGYNVIVWTVDDQQQMRDYLNDAVDGIISDQPDLGVKDAQTSPAAGRKRPGGA